MVALEKYHQTTSSFLDAIRESDLDLCAVEGSLYLYQDGAWEGVGKQTQFKLDRMLKSVCDAESFPYSEKYQPIWRNITAEVPVVSADTLDDCGWIALPNGTLNPMTRELFEHSPDQYITRRAAIAYDPEADCPEWRTMLQRMVEDKPDEEQAEYLHYLQCWFGLALVGFRKIKKRGMRKMLILEGPPSTSKSSIADVVRYLIGAGHIAGENVEQLSSRFGLETVFRSVAIVADDAAGYESKVKAEVFKKLITGDPVTADRKNRDVVQFRFHGPILLTTNNLPKIRDSTDALHGRTTLLRFTRVFTPEDANETLEGYGNALDFLIAKDEFPGILNWALDGLDIVRKLGRLPDVASAKEASEAWRGEHDPIYSFLREHAEYREGINNYALPVAAAISMYAEFQMGSREYPTTRVAQIVGRQISTLIPGVRPAKKQMMKEQARCYEGLLLRESGLQYVRLARERNLLPEKYVVNEAAAL